MSAAILAFTLLAAQTPYTEPVTFRFRSDQITYQGPIDSAWLMLDVEGGRNRVAGAQRMTCDGGNPKTCTLTVDLAEANYIYVYVANPDAFVDMTDVALNPDDIPDSNFFRDPNPRNPGFCGQFSTDNCLYVRNPKRPTFAPTTFQPGHGALVTTQPVALSIDLTEGSDGKALDAATAQAFYEDEEPPTVRYHASTTAPQPQRVEIQDVSFVPSAAGGTLTASLPNPPEGFHRVYFRIANVDGLAADEFETSILVNRDNRPPQARAGPSAFTSVNREVVLDGSLSEDPDHIGFTTFTWRVVDGPPGAVASFRCVDEELIPRDGFGKPVLDEHGNPQGDPCTRGDPGAIPRFKANLAGRYTVGLTVTDIGAGAGITSTESTTEVVVVDAFNLAVRARIEVVVDGNTITLDGSLTTGGAAAAFVQDGMNPTTVSLSQQGLAASFPKPSTPGAYFFHLAIDGSYPATAIVVVGADGSVIGRDFARPPEAWRTEKVLYLGYVREFFDASGDGEGDFLGMIDKMEYIADLGVTSIWLMPLSPGPTTHGYATTGFFGTEEDYGSAEELELLTETAKAFGLEVVMDLVANHTSDQHPFFKAANQNPTSPLRDLYAFDANGNYRYAFTFYALPDQNQNSPIVRQSLIDIVQWHFDRGIEGVRADIAGFTPPSFWRLLRRAVKARNPDAVLLAELIPPVPEFFDRGFDLAYDATTFWNLRDAFGQGGSFDGLDYALQDSTRFIEHAGSERARNETRQEDVLFMRYIDNQDEDRFLLRAGGDVRKAKAVAAVLLTMPGVPMITYGNEVGIAELRGRFPFFDLDESTMKFGSTREQLHAHYKKLITIRRGNRGLREQDNAPQLQQGNTYVRVSSGADEGGGNVYSFLRYGAGQRFLVLSNRADSTALGTNARVYPPAAALTDFPDGSLVLVDHLDPTVRVNLTRAQLTAPGGIVLNVPAFGSRIMQITKNGIPDEDGDRVLDSYDDCLGTSNASQADTDGDRVGDRCDACPGTLRGSAVGIDGCVVASSSAAPRARYSLDGKVDASAFEVAAGSGIKLYASFNGQQLYVATDAAARGEDVFLVVTDDTGRTAAAPFGKAGTTATGGIFLADEGENDFSKWFGTTGESVGKTEPLPGRGVLEGTLNLIEEFGAVPATIYIAAVRYGGGDAATIAAQAPAGNGDTNVDPDELYALSTELVRPVVDAGPDTGEGEGEGEGESDGGATGPEGDLDTDGVYDLVDNCVSVANTSQADSDGDGLGDGCDACPLSAPGAVVDDRGCGARVTDRDVDLGDRPTPRIVDANDVPPLQKECGCDAAGSTTDGGAGLGAIALVVVAGLARRRRGAR